jgi:hypothetical protein
MSTLVADLAYEARDLIVTIGYPSLQKFRPRPGKHIGFKEGPSPPPGFWTAAVVLPLLSRFHKGSVAEPQFSKSEFSKRPI